MIRPALLLVFVCCVTLATQWAPVFESLEARGGRSGSPLLLLVGDSRRLFANQFFVMADVYFHSGYYPTIFDARKKEGPSHLDVTEQEGGDTARSGRKVVEDDEKFMGTPRDWIERFGRNFFPTVHTHLQGGSAREIMPWLKLSAEMDPHRVDTYVTTSYWLRTRLDKADEAEQFLREGLRANPDSYDILLELGRVHFYNKKDPRGARNIWELALDKWRRQNLAGENPDPHVQEEILGELVRDDQQSGNLKQLLADLEELDKATPRNAVIEKEIQDVKAKLAH
jgi:tetratricopeptide (TPR) repeat protein